MTHAINSNTNLLSIDITRMHIQTGEKESGKEMMRESEKKKKKKNRRKENKI